MAALALPRVGRREVRDDGRRTDDAHPHNVAAGSLYLHVQVLRVTAHRDVPHFIG